MHTPNRRWTRVQTHERKGACRFLCGSAKVAVMAVPPESSKARLHPGAQTSHQEKGQASAGRHLRGRVSDGTASLRSHVEGLGHRAPVLAELAAGAPPCPSLLLSALGCRSLRDLGRRKPALGHGVPARRRRRDEDVKHVMYALGPQPAEKEIRRRGHSCSRGQMRGDGACRAPCGGSRWWLWTGRREACLAVVPAPVQSRAKARARPQLSG